ncbi:hypothetical protein L596_018130 [Steinernema carpocapsae]|nr:hypothetical protein L596_018130 [Steinernema carpocapsae]
MPEDDGFEAYPFKVSSYNRAVDGSPFKLDYAPNTMAILVLNTPKMFEVSFRRWITERVEEYFEEEEAEGRTGELMDPVHDVIPNPLQDFMRFSMKNLSEELSMLGLSHEIIHDFDMTPMRRPKILMQTAGHIAGAAYYYRPVRVPSEGKMIGLSLHPRYGGHFAFRGVVIFPEVQLPDSFIVQDPPQILQSDDEIQDAVELFNVHWRDGRFRDCGNPKETYSLRQRNFFAKKPEERWVEIEDWFSRPLA